MHQRLKEGPMEREPVPSAIVARLLEAAKELEEWAVEHRQATLAEHEKGVLRIFRRVMGPALGAVLERALGLDHPARPAATRGLSRVWRPSPSIPVAEPATGECVRRDPLPAPVLLVRGVSTGLGPGRRGARLGPPPDPEC